MLFDDRLATVLRQPARSEAGARTQYRQLLDLLGSTPEDQAGPPIESAYDRLAELADELAPTIQSAILRAPGLRLRSRSLVAFLARGEPQAAAAALATATLSESDWLHLIPRLSLTARGFLRHRRNLPFSARQVLDRLGVRDLVLPEPDVRYSAAAAPEPMPTSESEAGIGALVRRIEAFQRARRESGAAPRLPLGDTREAERLSSSRAFDFSTGADGTVDWADPAMAPAIVGTILGGHRPGAVATLDPAAARAIERRLAVRGGRAEFAGPPDIAGTWRIDAFPVFSREAGHFAGYHGRMRRSAPRPSAAATARDGGAGDKLRQLLHELRTPVSAIQGFAELIQQQLFGPAPNEYRALAAAVAVDAARLLAGFDEIDRLAQLESGAFELEAGHSDLREIVARTQRRLEGVLRQRSARIDGANGGPPLLVSLAEIDALQLVWRLLATLGGSLAPGEVVELSLSEDGHWIVLEMDLPAALMADEDPFASIAPRQPRAISAGMFGTGFALRLAREEAAAAGGTLDLRDERLRLALPALTGRAPPHTVEEGDSGAGSAA